MPPSVPLDRLASLAQNNHAVAVAPPVEVRHSTAALDSYFGNPLTGLRVKYVDHAATFAGGAFQAHPPPARRQLERLHGALLITVAGDGRDFGDVAAGEVPRVEKEPAAREKHFRAIRGEECRG